MKIVKKKISINADLSFVLLDIARDEFMKHFKVEPTTLRICVEDIFVAMEIKTKKNVRTNFWYLCDRKLPADAWQLEGTDKFNTTKLILYSPGA